MSDREILQKIAELAHTDTITQWSLGVGVSAIIAIMSIFIAYLMRMFTMFKNDVHKLLMDTFATKQKEIDRNESDVGRIDEDIRILENQMTGLKHDQAAIIKICEERHGKG